MRFLPLLFLIAAVTFGNPDTKPIVVRLTNGDRVVGRIVETECTNDILVLRELRGGAKRSIPWGEIKPDVATDLRVKLGFEVAEASTGLRMMGHEIKSRAGVTFTGLLLNEKTARKDGFYHLKTAEQKHKIRISDVIAGPTEVEVDALVVYTPRELYDRKIKDHAPTTPEDHFRLAEFARTVGALEEAKTHYETVLAANSPKYPEALVQRLLDRVLKRLANSEADAGLKDIKKQIVYNKFTRAQEKIDAFREKYKEDEDLVKAADALEEDLQEKRQEVFTTKIYKYMIDAVKAGIKAKIKEDEITFRQAQQYAGGDPSDEKSVSAEAIAAVAAKLEITPKEVEDFWKMRRKGSMRKAFYKSGTFIVVPDLKDALANVPRPKGKKDGPKPPKPHPQKTPDGWWTGKIKGKRFAELRQFLFAWWAEKSGMVEVLDPKLETCTVCSGRGYTSHMHTTNQGNVLFYDRCQNCHMAKGHRVVRFR